MDVSMEEEDIDMYSSPWENYLRLLNTVETLETGVRLSEDWYEEHKTHILKYRDVFMDFSRVNEEIEDEVFRRKAAETETILSSLVHEIITRGIFTVKMYLLLNKHMKALCEFIHGEDELLEMLGRMRM
jgi:hypothetical protein